MLRHPPGLPAPAARREVLETPPMVSAPPLLPTTSRERPGVIPTYNDLPPPQPAPCQERQGPTHMAALPAHFPLDDQAVNPRVDGAPKLPDVSEDVHAKVSQWLQRAHATPFLVDDEDSISEDDASQAKRRRCPIKSSRLCTRDSHMLY